MPYTIKQAANYLNLSIDTLRYYDKIGLISPKRSYNNYRNYDDTDILLLQYVSVMKYANFSLSEVKIMLELLQSEPSESCKKKAIELLGYKAIELERIIHNYSNLLELLNESIVISQSIESFPETHHRIDNFIRRLHHEIGKDYKGDKTC